VKDSPSTAASISFEPRHKAVFLDRDGVLNRALERDGKPYPPSSIAEFEVLPGVPEACQKLKAAGFLLVVATNQPDVGRGTLPQSVVEEIHAHLCATLPMTASKCAPIRARARPIAVVASPGPGMLRRAAQALGIDLRRSWMVGDRWRDIDCGHAAGCKTILIDYGYDEALRQPPDFRVRDLLEGAEIILHADPSGP